MPYALALGVVLIAGPAKAQNTIAAGTVEARPGEAVVVPIVANTTAPLSVLNVDVAFSSELCSVLQGQAIRGAGRVATTPEEGGIFCPQEGRIRLLYLSIQGTTLVPAGNGVIAEWTFTLAANASPGQSPLTVTVNQANDGPVPVALTASPGALQIVAAGATFTPTPTPNTPTQIVTSTATATRTVTVSATRTGSITPTGTATLTPTRTFTATASATPSATPTRSVTSTITATPTGRPNLCTGDCDGGGSIAINEIVLGVNLALGNGPIDACAAFDGNQDLMITINELIEAINNALSGCPLVLLCTRTDGCFDEGCGVLSGSLPLTLNGVTPDGASGVFGSCGGLGPERSFLFTAPNAAFYSASTAGSSFDTVLYALRGGCNGPEVACSDDSSDLTSRVTVGLNAGESVLFVVDGFSVFSSGPFALTVSQDLTVGPSCQTPGNAIRNCGFETGDFSDWLTVDIADPFVPLQVGGVGQSSGFGFFSSAPTEGFQSALHGFDGAGPSEIVLAQDVTLPAGVTSLQFDYRAAWDLLNFATAAQDRHFFVDIEPSGGGAPLQSTAVLTAPGGSVEEDTGPLSEAIGIASFAGTAVRVKFRWDVPEQFTGPSFFDLDNIRTL